MHYLLKKRGQHVIYIGQDMSLVDLKDAYEIHAPQYIFTMISETFAKEPVQDYVDSLSENFAPSKILLTGYQVVAQGVLSENNVVVLPSLHDTMVYLDNLS
jgi:hypothetical protein